MPSMLNIDEARPALLELPCKRSRSFAGDFTLRRAKQLLHDAADDV